MRRRHGCARGALVSAAPVRFLVSAHVSGPALLAEIEVKWHALGQRRSNLASLLDGLTPQQRRVMPMVSAGMLNKVIADRLNLSVRAIEEHRAKLFDKLDVGSAAQLATMLAEMRVCGLDPSAALPPGKG